MTERGEINGEQTLDVAGVAATRPGTFHNSVIALRENLRLLLTGNGSCVGGCEYIKGFAEPHLRAGERVLLRCNSFGAIKCLRAIEDLHALSKSDDVLAANIGNLRAELTGAPILRPPVIKNVAYHANLFDPVVWIGTVYSIPFRSDVMLGRNWWIPAPLIVHHEALYHRSAYETLRDMQ